MKLRNIEKEAGIPVYFGGGIVCELIQSTWLVGGKISILGHMLQLHLWPCVFFVCVCKCTSF